MYMTLFYQKKMHLFYLTLRLDKTNFGIVKSDYMLSNKPFCKSIQIAFVIVTRSIINSIFLML